MRDFRDLPSDVWIIFATTIVNRVGTMVMPFLALYLTQHLGLPPTAAGIALAVYGAGTLVSAPVAGRLCDRVGPLRVMQIGLALSGVLLFGVPLVRNLAGIGALIFCWAIVAEAVRPASLAALTAHVHPQQRKITIALNRFAINLGMSVGPAVGGFLTAVSFPMLFVIDGSTSIAAAVVLTLFLRARGLPMHDAVESGASRSPGGVLHDARMLAFLPALFLVFVMFRQIYAALPIFLVDMLHLPDSFLGLVFLVNTLLIIAFEIPVNVVTARWPLRPTLVTGACLIGVGFGTLAFATGRALVLLTVVIWTSGEMIFSPAAGSFVADLAPPDRRGEYMGAYWVAFALALIVGPWTGTVVLERFGAPLLWTITGACGIAAGLVLSVVAAPRTVGRPSTTTVVRPVPALAHGAAPERAWH